MILSFVGQDLCNQSFRGRKDLADADFTGADLRGCDFREAVLSSANFISTKTGKSHKQFLMLTVVTVTVGFAVIGAVAFAFVGEFPSAVAFASILAFAVVVSFAVAGLRAGTFVVAFAVLVSLAFTIALRAYNAFLLERSSEAIYYTIVS